MKLTKPLVAALLLTCLCAAPWPTSAADAKATKEKLKPYPLKTCLVTDEKLGSMGEAYAFDYNGQEIKFCCKGCLKDFKKNPDKYMKKLAEEEAKAKKKGKS